MTDVTEVTDATADRRVPGDLPALVRQRNETGYPVDPDLTIIDLIDAAAEAYPERPALRTNDSVPVTHRALREWSLRIAARLRAAGVRPGAPVAVLLDHVPAAVATILAVVRCGAYYVPVDMRWPVARAANPLASLSAAVIVTSPEYRARATEIADAVPGLDRIIVADPAESPDGALSGDAASGATPGNAVTGGSAPTAPRPGDLAYAITTSGSTGTPKVVGVRHASVVNLILWFNRRHGVTPDDTMLQVVSFTFDLSVYDLFGVLAAGAGLLLLDERDLAEPYTIAETLLAQPVTLWNSAPAMLSSVLPFARLSRTGERNRLRRVFLSGDWVPLNMHGDLTAQFPSATLVVLGGPTETTVWTNDFIVTGIDPRWRSIPYGRPISNVRCYALRDDLSPCDVDEPGELFLAGACLSAGYLNDPALTDERFPPDPWCPDGTGRMYRTGDRVRWTADGWMEFLGRLDNQIKLRGFRVELGEIESAARSVPGVREAFAVAVGVQPNAELGLAVRAAEPAEDQDSGDQEQELRRRLRDLLPSYLQPSIVLVADELPLTTSGKVDRRQLATLLAEHRRAAAGPGPADGAASVPDDDPAGDGVPDAAAMARLWSRVLDRTVRPDDHFLAIGGTSLVAMQLIVAIRETYDLRVSTETLFRAGSPAELVGRLGEGGEEPGSEPTWPARLDATRRAPLSVQQQAIQFLETMAPNSVGYNSVAQLHLRGPLDEGLLRTALAALVARHPVLRTRFPEDTGTGLHEQHVTDRVVVRLDVQEHPPSVAEAVRLAGRHVFDLANEPGIRWLLLRLGAEEHVLAQVEHHFVHDGWATWLLLQDTATAYRQLAAGAEVDLPPEQVSYADYTRWQDEWLTGEQAEQQVEYWLGELGAPAEPLRWPSEEHRPPVFSYRGDTCDVVLPAEVNTAVRGFAHTARTTPFAILMAAYAVLIGTACRTDDFVLGGGLRNRRLPGIGRTAGMFVNTCGFSFAGWSAHTFAELVRDTTRRLAAAMDHQEIPFPVVTRHMDISRDRSRNPVFQTSISMNDWDEIDLDYGPGITTDVRFPSNGGAKFDMDIIVLPEGESIRMLWRYCVPLLDRTATTELVERYFALLLELTARPDTALGAMTGLDAGTQRVAR